MRLAVLVLGLLLSVVTIGKVWATGLAGHLWFAATGGPAAQAAISPGLHVAIEGLPISDIGNNLSGLTWSETTQTLFAVVNDPPTVLELSDEGALLRRIPIANARDTEAITHLGGQRFFLADEADQSLHLVDIGPETQEITLGQGPKLALSFDFQSNMGFEGISWDSRGQRLFLVQEMLPLRVMTVDGVAEALAGQSLRLRFREWPLGWANHLALVDLSSVSLNEATGHLLLLSHMSGMLLELDREGRTVASLSLRPGEAGLPAAIPQAEGLAVDGSGRIFIVSEPNLFYRFDPA